MNELDLTGIASDWLRAIRGKRSQTAFSRRLGYRSNIAYRWEAGQCFPTATLTFKAIALCGGDVNQSLRRFHRTTPSWLATADLRSAAGIARLLDDLRGKTSIVDLAARTGYSRFSISRWLKGEANPTLVEFLKLIDQTSLRLLDFIASFTDPDSLPRARKMWQLLIESRKAAYDLPWSHAVLRTLELAEYQHLPQHRPGWIARQLGITEELEQHSLGVLERSRQIQWDGHHYRPLSTQLVDTRDQPERARALRAWWTEVGLQRLKAGTAGLFSYNLSAVSRHDLQRIEQLQRAYYREMTRIIAESAPADCVVLYAAQLLELTDASDE